MSTSSSPTSRTAPGSTPVDVFELGSEHEQVVFCTDEATGLRAAADAARRPRVEDS